MAGAEENSSSRSSPWFSSSSSSRAVMVLDCVRLQSKADEGFWRKLSSLKLDVLKTDDSPIEITGYIQPCSHPMVSEPLSVYAESLPSVSCENKLSLEITSGNRNRCPIPGILYNMNTMESFLALDKKDLLKKEAEKIWKDICSGKAEENSNVLLRFLLITYADLKKWKFHYMFAFPAFILDPPATVIHQQSVSEYFKQEEAESLSVAFNTWRTSNLTTDTPFFLVSILSDSQAVIRPLKDWKNCHTENHKLLFGFYDPCHEERKPGWPLRNFLSFISLRWKLDKISFLCYRERHGKADLELSLVGEALVSLPQEWRNHHYVPKILGWEQTNGRIIPKRISLAESMDPTRLAVSAADLNLKLMRWRTLPSLNLNTLYNVKCLLLGAGTLGCQVARMLMAWGIRKITLVDNGRVAMSNPLRQSLYTFDDCSKGGELKALAAAKSLKRIFPAVESEGISLSIPMPGHPISVQETDSVFEDCKNLKNLVASHDVIFLLTDTRESRWLPTLLCADSNKIAITAALGFDSYLVMRHGAGPTVHESDVECEANAVEYSKGVAAQMEKLSTKGGDEGHRLGCYFCNDVVAPMDSTSNRTLDQQCTVTRPGLAPIASALAVELLVGILHHPDGLNAPGELADSVTDCVDRPLGILPHQIRGSLPQFSQLTLAGYSSNGCTACCSTVVSEYRKRGLNFILQAINHPTYLEDLTGLTELMKSATSFDVDWDNYVDDDDV